jgi:hypothetical protein
MKIRNSLRLSLRELLWATTLAGVGLGWYLDHRRVNDMREWLDEFDACAASRPPNEFSCLVLRRGVTFAVHGMPFMVDGVPIEDRSDDQMSAPPDNEVPPDENAPPDGVPPAP